MTNNNDPYQFTKSFEKTLETLRDIFGSNNEDLIASAIRFLKEEEEREEQEKKKGKEE
jgi:hypothetical protein